MNAVAKRPTRKGFFITFEGGEGVGKSTQIKRLSERLKKLGAPLTNSREPGGTVGAEAVRHVVLDKAAAEPLGPELEALMFAAARLDHVEQVITPALNKGHVVIIDRFMDSSRVYQGASNDLPKEFVAALERIAISGAVPDLTIILDLDPAIGLKRAAARRAPETEVDRFEGETLKQHEDRRAAFLKIAKAEPDRCKVIDASQSEDEVSDAIWAVVKNAIQSNYEPVKSAKKSRKPMPAAKL